jgi:hypothetical protein
MHVLHRPHLPRPISLSIAAAVLAIVISLALTASISNINQSAGNAISRQSVSAQSSSVSHATRPHWASDPFARLASRALPPWWLSARP